MEGLNSDELNIERDDLTFAEIISNLLLFGVFVLITIVFIVKSSKAWRIHKHSITLLHYSIFLLILTALVSR